jgi:hypothetical protein
MIAPQNKVIWRRGVSERSPGLLNRAQYPSDVIALRRLRYRLSLRDLAELSLIRGIVFSYEAVRDWEAKRTTIPFGIGQDYVAEDDTVAASKTERSTPLPAKDLQSRLLYRQKAERQTLGHSPHATLSTLWDQPKVKE